jgi:hypothetical protein
MAAHGAVLDAHERGKATDGEADAAPFPEVKGKLLKGETGDVAIGEGEAAVALVVRPNVNKDERIIDVTNTQRAPLQGCDMVMAAKEHSIAGARG